MVTESPASEARTSAEGCTATAAHNSSMRMVRGIRTRLRDVRERHSGHTIFIFIIGVGGFTAARNPAGGTAFQRSRQVFWLVLAAMRLPENYPVSSRFRGNGGRHKTLSLAGGGEVCTLSVAGGTEKDPRASRRKKRTHSYGYSRSLALRSLLAPRRPPAEGGNGGEPWLQGQNCEKNIKPGNLYAHFFKKEISERALQHRFFKLLFALSELP